MKSALVIVALSTAGCASQSALTFQDDLENHTGQSVAISGTLLVNGSRVVLCPPTVSEDNDGCLVVRGPQPDHAIAALHAKCATVSGTIQPPEPTRAERGVGIRASIRGASVVPCNGR
jgi:hypothetical protein